MSVLLYAPDFTGHPQVYCRVIARALLDAGERVVIAGPSDVEGWRARWPALRPLADEPAVSACDIRRHGAVAHGGLTAEQLIEIQRATGADVTLFIHADDFETQFRRIAAGAAPRLRGRVCAIFSHTCRWYPGEDPYTGRSTRPGWNPRRWLGHARRALFRDEEAPRYFFEQVLLRQRTVDAVIVKDERVAERYGPPVRWMPEIYRVFDLRPEERRGADWERFAGPIRECFDRAGAANVLLYFGTAAWYKGYDWWLRLALSDDAAFALHAGAPDRREPGKTYDLDIEAARRELLRQGRLYETGAFVESADLIELLFGSVRWFVSTHRLTLSSGTMLQALEQGAPVLTADTGLVGWRTRTFGLGATYRYGDPEDLLAQWRRCRQATERPASEQLRAYMNRFSRTETERFFVETLLGRAAR